MARREGTWTAACVAVTVAVVAIDAAFGGDLAVLLVAGPVMASALLRPRRTAVVATLAVVGGTAAATEGGPIGRLDVARLVSVAAIGGVCVTAAQARMRREQRLERLARVAEVAQQAILHPVPPRVGHVHFASRYLSAAEDTLVGGDLFDVVSFGDKVRLVVGDVRGKGIDAIRLAALTLSEFRVAAAVEVGVAEVAKAVDGAIIGYLGPEDFVTAVFVEFGDDGQLSVVNCGHHAPLLVSADGRAVPLDGAERCLPLGLGPQFPVAKHRIGRNDRLLVYTDGLVEARNPAGSFFDLADLPDGALTAASLDTTLDVVIDRLLLHVGGRLADDMALVLAQPEPGATLPCPPGHGSSQLLVDGNQLALPIPVGAVELSVTDS